MQFILDLHKLSTKISYYGYIADIYNLAKLWVAQSNI